jgi:hypothetical protein
MKKGAFVALVVLLLATARQAGACDCSALKPPSPAIRTEAPMIFEGQVVEIIERSLHITRITPSDSTGETRPLGREVVFQVARAWAGITTRRVSLFVEDSDCAFPFEAGGRYVVFARRGAKGRATTSVCMRTSEADRAQDVLKALGPARPIRRVRSNHP